MSEMVYVGQENLVGEVISLKKDATTVQVFEETSGLKPGETVTASGDAISVTLGPGILDNIFDGIQRPLSVFPISTICSRTAPPRWQELWRLSGRGGSGENCRMRRSPLLWSAVTAVWISAWGQHLELLSE